MEKKRIKVRLTENSPYSNYGYYEKGDIGYIDGYVNDNAVIILENGKFAKADLRWIEAVNEEDKNVNTELKESGDELTWLKRFIQEEIDCLSIDIRDSEDRVKLKNLQRSFSWLEKQSKESKVEQAMREVEEKAEAFTQAHKGETSEEILAQMRGEQYTAWSEGDERIYQSIMDDTVQENQLNGKQTNWLRDIKYRYFPQPKQEWSEEDKKMSRFIGNAITADDASAYLKSKGIQVIDAHVWLEELKERVQPQPKQEWNEEDERIYNRICDIVHAAAFANYDVDEDGKECGEYAKIMGWFKSLKERYSWRPSDELIKAVRLARSFVTDDFSDHPTLSELLIELEKQLKKLREV